MVMFFIAAFNLTYLNRITDHYLSLNYTSGLLRLLSASAALRVLLLLDLAQRRLGAAIAASAAAALGRRGLGLNFALGESSRGRWGRGQV